MSDESGVAAYADEARDWAALTAASAAEAMSEFGSVDDGFGSEWDRCGHDCDLQVVRPGKSQCNYQGEACPNRRDCEACPFLGCDGCEAEVARRANGEAK